MKNVIKFLVNKDMTRLDFIAMLSAVTYLYTKIAFWAFLWLVLFSISNLVEFNRDNLEL